MTTVTPDPVPQITIDDLTTVDKTNGTGTFDVLMRSVKEHMVDEYTQGRIQGPEYSTVYLGALQQTMQQSIAFLLAKDKTSYELELLRLQAEMLELQKLELAEKVKLIDAQVRKTEVEIELAELQKCNVAAECEQIKAQTCKLQAEFDLIILNKAKVQEETELIQDQQEKIAQEIGLLGQKKITEQAQTSAEVIGQGSVIGKQNELYSAQTRGFAEKQNQEAAKIMVSTWNTRKMTDETGVSADGAGLGDDAIKGAIETLNNP